MKRHLSRVLVVATALVLAGCVGFHSGRRNQRASSIADFLYPKQQEAVRPGQPLLRLPLRVGVAFVPAGSARVADFSEYDKQRILEKAASAFRAERIVESVQVIPTSYLRQGGGFENLDQLRRMLGIDVVVLLAYDQIQFSSENFLSLSYWTIVGAYTVHGNRNETHTMVEAVVCDIAIRELLFRAPGAHLSSHSSSLVGLAERQRHDQDVGLERASEEMLANLSRELGLFKARVREGDSRVRVENRPGYTGAGATDLGGLLLLGSAALLALARRRATPA